MTDIKYKFLNAVIVVVKVIDIRFRAVDAKNSNSWFKVYANI